MARKESAEDKAKKQRLIAAEARIEELGKEANQESGRTKAQSTWLQELSDRLAQDQRNLQWIIDHFDPAEFMKLAMEYISTAFAMGMRPKKDSTEYPESEPETPNPTKPPQPKKYLQ